MHLYRLIPVAALCAGAVLAHDKSSAKTSENTSEKPQDKPADAITAFGHFDAKNITVTELLVNVIKAYRANLDAEKLKAIFTGAVDVSKEQVVAARKAMPTIAPQKIYELSTKVFEALGKAPALKLTEEDKKMFTNWMNVYMKQVNRTWGQYAYQWIPFTEKSKPSGEIPDHAYSFLASVLDHDVAANSTDAEKALIAKLAKANAKNGSLIAEKENADAVNAAIKLIIDTLKTETDAMFTFTTPKVPEETDANKEEVKKAKEQLKKVQAAKKAVEDYFKAIEEVKGEKPEPVTSWFNWSEWSMMGKTAAVAGSLAVVGGGAGLAVFLVRRRSNKTSVTMA